MKNVEVIKIPVRYNGQTYKAGEPFEMEADHVDASLVKVLGDVVKKPKTIDEMTVAELKAYAAENEIDLGDAKKRDDFVDAIKKEEVARAAAGKNDGGGEGDQTPPDN